MTALRAVMSNLLSRIALWHWLLIGFGVPIALDIFVVGPLLPYEIWLTWFVVKAISIFLVLPIGSLIILFFIPRPD